jgi:YesN/AraC family two-component response regulator
MAGAKDLMAFSESIRILYVEDDESLRKDTYRLLSTFFKQVDIAENGKVAFDLYEPGKFDIVISDFVMPEMNGLELTKAINAINASQMIIILSAHNEYHYVEELKASGAKGFIFKPLNIQQFIDTIFDACVQITKPDQQD